MERRRTFKTDIPTTYAATARGCDGGVRQELATGIGPRCPPRKRKKYGGRKQGSRNLATIKRELRAELYRKNSVPSLERATWATDMLMRMLALSQPITRSGKPRAAGNRKAFMEELAMLRDFLALRMGYEHPKLAAIAVLPQPEKRKSTTVTVNIFNQRGERLNEEGEVIEGEPLQMEDHVERLPSNARAGPWRG